jgi:hypothetical protein
MALTTYTELKDAVASRLRRSDLTAFIPDFITLAEKSLNRTLKGLMQEYETTLTATIGNRTLAASFSQPIALYLTTYLPRDMLIYVLPDQMQVYNDNGYPEFWTVDGFDIKLDRPADIAYTFAFRYRDGLDLAATNTNAVLDRYPDLYFYGALVQAAEHIKDAASLQKYEDKYRQVFNECANDYNATRSLATLSTEFGYNQRSRILTG